MYFYVCLVIYTQTLLLTYKNWYLPAGLNLLPCIFNPLNYLAFFYSVLSFSYKRNDNTHNFIYSLDSKGNKQSCINIYRISQILFPEDMEKALVLLLCKTDGLMLFAKNILELILTFLIK